MDAFEAPMIIDATSISSTLRGVLPRRIHLTTEPVPCTSDLPKDLDPYASCLPCFARQRVGEGINSEDGEYQTITKRCESAELSESSEPSVALTETFSVSSPRRPPFCGAFGEARPHI